MDDLLPVTGATVVSIILERSSVSVKGFAVPHSLPLGSQIQILYEKPKRFFVIVQKVLKERPGHTARISSSQLRI